MNSAHERIVLNFFHSRPQRLRSIWPAPWIETSGRLQSVLVTDWSDANTIKSDKPEKKHEAWPKGTNKANFFGNVRLPYSQREILGAIHSTKISGNSGPKLNGSVRSNRKSFEKTGPPFEVVLFSRSDRLEFWLNGSRPL